MIHRVFIVLIDPFTENDERVPDEKVSNVSCHDVVDAMRNDPLSYALVDRQLNVIVFVLVSRVVGNVAIDGIVARFRDPIGVFGKRFQTTLGRGPVIDAGSDHVPSSVDIGEIPAECRRGGRHGELQATWGDDQPQNVTRRWFEDSP